MPIDPNTFLETVHDSETVEDTKRVYGEWASTYEETMTAHGYRSPWVVASVLMVRVSDKQTRILDVGCGTGMTGVSLAKVGFTDVDGLDVSPEMLDQARAKSVYKNLVTADLLQTVDIADETYGAAVSVGTFTFGHVGPDRIPEIMRLIKTRGLFALTVRVEAWDEHSYDEYLNSLVEKGALTILDDQIQSHFDKRDQRAHFLVLGKN